MKVHTWEEAQKWENDWWGDCANTFNEELKQLVYARKMGLSAYADYGKYPVYDLQKKSILDIGGGPVSLLLKCKNGSLKWVADPCKYPQWIADRYEEVGITYQTTKGEELDKTFAQDIKFDEVWIYNVLQHTEDPQKIIDNAKKLGNLIRIFEWVDMPPEPGHPQVLTKALLDGWLGGDGKVEELNENGCVGKAYYGIFPTV